ncbi:helix-turn-helix domain-containing protein [Dysgonomonas macrotermitis]|uniref:Helix-turn-helix domain-containing protein n=1 Tax=Dysgonomonas macrotermitis TaxID=1346286 RepID=A0A1M5GW93_9BACT|nr:helix-turn-helix domain-containing protein [Dysgonomonas macrotermitis]SHG07980.1 Helix-turn-helix domain-containing protein [Dysgonomonas macrotermitis]
MEIKMIEGKVYERFRQQVKALLEKTRKLSPKRVDEEWYNNRDVCRLLGVSLRTLQTYRDKGLIPYSQVGHKCYYKIKDVECFMEKNRTEMGRRQR